MRINNKVFAHLYTQSRTQKEFVYEEDVRKKSEDGDVRKNTFENFD